MGHFKEMCGFRTDIIKNININYFFILIIFSPFFRRFLEEALVSVICNKTDETQAQGHIK